MFMFKPVRSALFLALALALPGLAAAEESESESPAEELEAAQLHSELPKAALAFIAYLEDLDTRYPDSYKVDLQALYDAEGETLALHYCAAVGVDGPCVPVEGDNGSDEFLPAGDIAVRDAVDGGKWYDWLWGHTFNIGVIPHTRACSNGATLATIHHDDEDRRNINSHSGWIGATRSNDNTTWRFCKLDGDTSQSFRPLPKSGNEYDYSVLNMGVLCPSGARRVIRIEEGEVWRSANDSSGGVFPNFRVYNVWFNFYCHFDGGAGSQQGYMNAFPSVGFSYGVYGPKAMPSNYALEKGRVFQDDEDILNINYWIGDGDSVMSGGRNTERRLIKVR